MSATIIPFPASSQVQAAQEDGGSISSFIQSLQEARQLNRQYKLTGPEWLQIIDLERTGMASAQAAQLVAGRRGP